MVQITNNIREYFKYMCFDVDSDFVLLRVVFHRNICILHANHTKLTIPDADSRHDFPGQLLRYTKNNRTTDIPTVVN